MIFMTRNYDIYDRGLNILYILMQSLNTSSNATDYKFACFMNT